MGPASPQLKTGLVKTFMVNYNAQTASLLSLPQATGLISKVARAAHLMSVCMVVLLMQSPYRFPQEYSNQAATEGKQ